ncbi:hypothetical protein FB45DRAFT_1051144 [Roridomyces roridus]|uniref:Uncharacterized protein n=1 Tax=Roridomyces roridus TaxID=1738132 RepID=A0AAD7FZY2_9AGAR|nr:hypothetical protein FB45DRAFT_1051144 [Roridomyces roridus]
MSENLGRHRPEYILSGQAMGLLHQTPVWLRVAGRSVKSVPVSRTQCASRRREPGLGTAQRSAAPAAALSVMFIQSVKPIRVVLAFCTASNHGMTERTVGLGFDNPHLPKLCLTAFIFPSSTPIFRAIPRAKRTYAFGSKYIRWENLVGWGYGGAPPGQDQRSSLSGGVPFKSGISATRRPASFLVNLKESAPLNPIGVVPGGLYPPPT